MLRQGRGNQESEEGDGDGNPRKHGKSLRGLWRTTGGGGQLQIPGKGDDGRRRRLAGGGWEFKKGKEKLGKNEPDPDEGGSDGKDLWDVLQERHPADPSFRS